MVRVDIETIVMAAGPVPSLIVLRERCGKSDSTAPLRSLSIQTGSFDDHNVLLVCNEEAKLLGLPENRFLRNRNGIPYDIIHGTFFLAQGSGEEFCSLTDKQIQTYTRLYSREKLFVMQHGKVINQPKKGTSTHER